MGFPLGSWIGLASTSIVEDLIAGYVAPERWGWGGVGVDLTGASILGSGEGAVLRDGCGVSDFGGGPLWGSLRIFLLMKEIRLSIHLIKECLTMKFPASRSLSVQLQFRCPS